MCLVVCCTDYLNARYYDPESGRFITQDTYRGELDEPGTWHLYAYCANNPINYVDPSGHWNVKISNSGKKYSLKFTILWKEVSEILTKSSAINSFIAVGLSRVPNPIAVAACDTFLRISVVSAVATMIGDKYLKNKSIKVILSFKYKIKYKKRVTRKSKKVTVKYKYYSIYNGKVSVSTIG